MIVVMLDGDKSTQVADIARARSMSDIARLAGLTREALYKALRPNAHPCLDTISKVRKALGVKLHVEPI